MPRPEVANLAGASLTDADLALLSAIDRNANEARRVSAHLVRLEMMGLVLDGATGLRLTPKGRELLRIRKPRTRAAEAVSLSPERTDSRGRRLPRSHSVDKVLL